jgi:regulator of protease activity HflC (stomatin/prohibitin superfamily)
MLDPVEIIAIVIPLVVIVYAIVSSLRIVRPTEKGLVERLGRYHRFVQGGITLLSA